jgi:hypothetical protein
LDVATIGHASVEQLLEQAAEDHGVGDLRDVEFVEAEQARLIGDVLGGGRDRIIAGIANIGGMRRFSACESLRHSKMKACASSMKSWKWTRRLSFSATALEEQVHQHGLAAADCAPDVEAARLAATAKPAARRRQLLRQRVQPSTASACAGSGETWPAASRAA